MPAEHPYPAREAGPLGLDRRRRPASMRDRIVIGLRQSAPFSSLQRRIIFFNLLGLAVLVFGVLYLNEFRTGLIEERANALLLQGDVIAITISESADPDSGAPFETERALRLLSRLAEPSALVASLYDAEGRLAGQAGSHPEPVPAGLAGPAPATEPPADILPPAGDPAPGAVGPGDGPRTDLSGDGVIERIEASYRRLIGDTPEARGAELVQTEERRAEHIRAALAGRRNSAVHFDAVGNLAVTVYVPISTGGRVLGALELSTTGGDINEVVQRERVVILQVFVIASLVSVALAVLLANTIARPIRRLARAVDPEGTSRARPINPDRIEIPDMTRRTDEIGDLSAALIRMTDALYRRIEAIESFAADVAHEIKNPLTSLRSAVETMAYAKTPEQRQRLLDVIQNDVGRLDRLVTDISNASRLDAELVRERMAPFDLGGLIAGLAEIARAHGEKLGVEVATQLPREPLMARGLEGRIAQVITNLTDNALSFSPRGTRITVRGEQLERGGVRLTVSDQGPGIPEENLGSIFERFYSERPAEGFGNHSGLGLSICRQIVEAHGGRIWAENIRPAGSDLRTPSRGARFTVELPS